MTCVRALGLLACAALPCAENIARASDIALAPPDERQCSLGPEIPDALRAKRRCVAAERVILPDTPVSARIPHNYVCSSASTSMFEGMEAHVVECLPFAGGQGISLEKEIGSHVPTSLQAQLEEWKARATKEPAMSVVPPHSVRASDRDAIEEASKGNAFFDGPNLHSTGQILVHRLIIQDGTDFYECSTMTMASSYTQELRDRLHEFCDSLTFKN